MAKPKFDYNGDAFYDENSLQSKVRRILKLPTPLV